MRLATLVLVVLAACTDLREFRGSWSGPRVGDAAELKVGVSDATAVLDIDQIDSHGLVGRLSVSGLLPATPITSLAGAEADELAGMTFTGGPLRVYLAFVPVPDGGGEALAVVALYEDRRISVRLLRGGTAPLYGIFALTGPVGFPPGAARQGQGPRV